MRVYVGQTRSRKLIAQLNALGIGEMTVRGEYHPRRTPWAFDNGAYGDWKKHLSFDVPAYFAALDRMQASLGVAVPAPDFIVVPDIVAGGLSSLLFSLRWQQTLRERGWCGPLYLAVQDGMRDVDVQPHAHLFQGLFVGGTLKWKLQTAGLWIELGRLWGKPVHIGRVGTAPRVRWARRIGASSIDSSLPLWSSGNLKRFLRALTHGQQELFR